MPLDLIDFIYTDLELPVKVDAGGEIVEVIVRECPHVTRIIPGRMGRKRGRTPAGLRVQYETARTDAATGLKCIYTKAGSWQEVFLVCENADNWRAMIDLARDENGDRSDDLRALSVPTLVLWGADDVAYPLDRFGRRFAADIADARLEILDGIGHYPQEEDPAAVVERIRAFAAELR